MIRKSARAVAGLMSILAVLGIAGVAAAVDAPKWVAALYVEQQKMVGLRWMPVPGATAYKVFRTTTPGKDQQEIGSVATPQHLDTAVEPGTTYYYSLKAEAGAELSAFSDERSVAIPGEKKSGVETPEIESVTLQTSTEFGKTVYKVGVLWRGKGVGALAYNLYRSLEPGKQGDMIASSQETRYVDVAVEPGKTYYYSVTALDPTFQETKPSAEKSVEVKAPQVAAVKKAKKEYPKLVAIPSRKGERMLMPSDPSELQLGDDGTIYVTAGWLYELDSFGGELKHITSDLFTSVNGLGLGLGGELLIASKTDPKVIVKDGNKYKEVEIPPLKEEMKNSDGKVIPKQKPRPGDVTQNIDGKYWVTDTSNNRVLIFSEDWEFLGHAAAGTPEEVLQNATSIVHDSKGNVFAASGGVNYINIYDKDGTWTGQFGETGNIAGTFGRLGGIMIDRQDNLWACDVFNASIQKFDTTGKFLGAISGEDGKSNLNLKMPSSMILLDEAGKKAVVAEGISKSLQEFTILE